MATVQASTPAGSQQTDSSFVPFPLLVDPDYDPNTFDYYNAAGEEGLPTMQQWIEVSRSSIPGFAKTAAQDQHVDNAKEKARQFEQKCATAAAAFCQSTFVLYPIGQACLACHRGLHCLPLHTRSAFVFSRVCTNSTQFASLCAMQSTAHCAWCSVLGEGPAFCLCCPRGTAGSTALPVQSWRVDASHCIQQLTCCTRQCALAHLMLACKHPQSEVAVHSIECKRRLHYFERALPCRHSCSLH